MFGKCKRCEEYKKQLDKSIALVESFSEMNEEKQKIIDDQQDLIKEAQETIERLMKRAGIK